VRGDIMKKLFIKLMVISLSFSLVGCNFTQQGQTQDDIKSEGFIEPELSERDKYMKPVREYLYYRTKAVLNKDIQVLWDRYPNLQNNIDPKTGVNHEKYEVESYDKGFILIDANFRPESRDRIKVKTINDKEIIVLVHGDILYVKEDFQESGGEFLIELFLNNEGNDWTVVKTDEYLLHEYKEWIKNR
jgi:uncharacterized lipoprotein NlpE involved in copper resistance